MKNEKPDFVLIQETDIIREAQQRIEKLKRDLKKYDAKLNENSLLISIYDLDLHRLFRENKELYHRCQMFGCGFQLKMDLR
jgi:hypothetical protein